MMTNMIWVKARSLTKDKVQSTIGVRGHCDQDQDSEYNLDRDSLYDLEQGSSHDQARIQHVTTFKAHGYSGITALPTLNTGT